MNWQLPLVALIIALSVTYLAFQSYRTWRGRKAGCGGGCSCATTPQKNPLPDGVVALIPIEELTLRRRPAGPL